MEICTRSGLVFTVFTTFMTTLYILNSVIVSVKTNTICYYSHLEMSTKIEGNFQLKTQAIYCLMPNK